MDNKKELTLTFRGFPSQAAIDKFAVWLCESGEQDYWTWMECQDDESVVTFDYHHPQDKSFPMNDARRFATAKFINNNEILIESDTVNSDQD